MLAARIAAAARWKQQDPVAGTSAARGAFLARFEDEVDPDRVLDPVERARRAECAKREYFLRLRLRGIQKAEKQKAVQDESRSTQTGTRTTAVTTVASVATKESDASG